MVGGAFIVRNDNGKYVEVVFGQSDYLNVKDTVNRPNKNFNFRLRFAIFVVTLLIVGGGVLLDTGGISEFNRLDYISTIIFRVLFGIVISNYTAYSFFKRDLPIR